MTPVLVLTPVLLFGFTLVLILRVVIKLHRGCDLKDITPDWLASFSVADYQPMRALLCDEDFAFLSRQPGFDLALYKKLRRDRLRIFRQYMDRLVGDYNRLHAASRALLAINSQDRSEMAMRLIWLKLMFTAAVLRAEGNYLLCRVGFRTLAVRALLLRLEELTAQVAAISAVYPA